MGWQIVQLGTDDPPPGMATYEIYTFAFVLKWIEAHLNDVPGWRLLPIFDGDVQDPVFISADGGLISIGS